MIVIVGSNGFCKNVLDVLIRLGYSEIACFDDSRKDNESLFPGGPPIINNLQNLPPLHQFVLGVGKPSVRKHYFDLFARLGGLPKTIISPMASVVGFGCPASVGIGCTIMPSAAIASDVKLGKGCLVNMNASVGHDSCLGDFVEVCPGSQIGGRCTIGDLCMLGLGAVVLPDLQIAPNSIIGAGAVVVKDIIEAGTYVGSPARRIK